MPTVPPLPDTSFTLRFGTTRVKVKWDSNLSKEGIFGQFDPKTMEIRLSRGMCPDQARTTLVHECGHVIFELSGLSSMESRDEETVVAASASWWRTLFEQNPVLIREVVKRPRKK